MLEEAEKRIVGAGVSPKGGERLTYHFLYVELHAELQLKASTALLPVRGCKYKRVHHRYPGQAVMNMVMFLYLHCRR